MAVVIIVEDGTGVNDANSYVSVAQIRTYATNRGLAISNDDDVVGAAAINAMDYIESKKSQYLGTKTYAATCFPRTNLYDQYAPDSDDDEDLAEYELINFYGYGGYGYYSSDDYNEGTLIPSNVIPADIIAAQCLLASKAASGIKLMPDSIGAFIKMQQIGPTAGIVKQFDPNALAPAPSFPLVDALLAPYMIGNNSFSLSSKRV